MAIAEPLAAGLEAYHRADFVRARDEWARAAPRVEDERDRLLVVSLARLAGALAMPADAEDAETEFLQAEAGLGAVADTALGVDVLALRASLARGLTSARHHRPAILPPPRVPLGATLRFLSMFALAAAAVLVLRFTPLGEYLDREKLVALFTSLRESPLAPLILIGLYILLAPTGLPMTPLIIVGGVVFGRWQGAAINIVGCVLGAALSFLFARFMGRDFVRRVGGKRLKRIESTLRRHGFWTLVGVRFMPVPFPVVNFGAALAGVKFGTFVLSAILGLTPALLIYTSFASGLFEMARGGERSGMGGIGILFGGVVVLATAPIVVRQLNRKRRYHRLLAERQVRRRTP